jgi:hypothetical protein
MRLNLEKEIKMEDVNKVFITKEVSELLDINPSYLIRLAKKLSEEEKISDTDMRSAGKRNYLFTENAIKSIKEALKRK